ncbi:MAG: DNA-directed RNA polymerase subunit beta' [Parcubacteria group bacterium GW2011_GWC1_41_7]|nr:MAG: DNA-directed RNA polymerase subunit beta' [Parcubacteria group bacterium GW2011_GWC1_41_7]
MNQSFGEVVKPETINYRTGRPERDGLFSEVIFGPVKDFECYCGKYKKNQFVRVKCDRCGVDVTHSSVRRERMGHITLATPVTHIWFMKVYPYAISLFLNIPVSHLEKVVYYSSYIVTRVNDAEKKKLLESIEKAYKEKVKASKGTDDRVEVEATYKRIKEELKNIQVKKVLTDLEFFSLSRKYPNLFEVGIGSEPIRRFLEEIDLQKLRRETDARLKKATGVDRKRLSLLLKFSNAFIKEAKRPEWMILTVLPVIPPDLRPIVQLEGGKYASSDPNDLYRRVINRNNRLKRLYELKAPDIIVRNEKRMLQEAIDALLDNALKKDQGSTGQRKVLKSLADMLRGKSGRFRQNLLGKRVDYSGRSVIVVGPELNLNECGLPKKIALEIFKPFIIHELLKAEVAHTIKQANYLIESEDPEALKALEVVIRDKYVLLNRAPTLHRLGMQAFKPVLVEGLAIRIPPYVCAAYNADFDGDQMAVFLPLSDEAQTEAKEKKMQNDFWILVNFQSEQKLPLKNVREHKTLKHQWDGFCSMKHCHQIIRL